ncbi:MAG: hypothetical protein ABSA11_04815 [Candidatus Bathyarchaeia archaeon]
MPKVGTFEISCNDIIGSVTVIQPIVHTSHLDLWGGSPNVADLPLAPNTFGMISRWPASSHELENWTRAIDDAYPDLSLRGVKAWQVGISKNGTIVVTMDAVSSRSVGVFLSVLRDVVPPGILFVRRGGPMVSSGLPELAMASNVTS